MMRKGVFCVRMGLERGFWAGLWIVILVFRKLIKRKQM